jgi:cytochrome c553
MTTRLPLILIAALMLPLAPAMAADIEAGRAIYAAQCAQCHGRTGRGTAVFPRLAGQDAQEITENLELYRAGETVGPNSALMIPVATALSDDDVAAVAAFIDEAFD